MQFNIILILEPSEFKQSLLMQMFFRIKRKDSFNQFYMIASDSKLSDDHEKLLRAMYWNYNVLNAVVVAMENDRADPNIVTYNPFKNISIRIPNNAYKKEELFIEKNSNIFGSPMNIVMYKDTVTSLNRGPGTRPINFNYDDFLPQFKSSAMNATPILKTPFTKDLNIEEVRIADLTINGGSFNVNELHNIGIEETISMRRDDICVFVPYNRIRNMFRNVSKTVRPIVWVMMTLVIFQTWICLYIIKWAQQRCLTANHNVYLFDLFGFHMNQSLMHMPKQFTSRLVIGSWLLYCLIMNSAFQGSLYTNLAKNIDSRISTVEELLQTNQHELLVSNIFYNYSGVFLDSSPIKNRFEVIKFQEYLKRVESNQIHYAYVARKRGAKYFENVRIVNGLPVYYTMEQCIVPLMTYYFVRRGCPFLNRINHLLRLAEESGLFDYREEQLTNAYNKQKQNQRLFIHRTAASLEHISFVFEMWGYGLVLSTVIFIIERYASRIKNWLIVK